MDGSYQPPEVSSCRLAEFRLTVDPATAVVRYVGIPRVWVPLSWQDKGKESWCASLASIIRSSGSATSTNRRRSTASCSRFEVLGDYGDMIGWTNGKTRFWIGQADEEGLKHPYRLGDIGFHH
jgi:hypothetical protein